MSKNSHFKIDKNQKMSILDIFWVYEILGDFKRFDFRLKIDIFFNLWLSGFNSILGKCEYNQTEIRS